MQKAKSKTITKKVRFSLAVLFVGTITVLGFYLFLSIKAFGAETISFKIIPGTIEESVGWEDGHKVLSQDMDENSSFDDFSKEISAFSATTEASQFEPSPPEESESKPEEEVKIEEVEETNNEIEEGEGGEIEEEVKELEEESGEGDEEVEIESKPKEIEEEPLEEVIKESNEEVSGDDNNEVDDEEKVDSEEGGDAGEKNTEEEADVNEDNAGDESNTESNEKNLDESEGDQSSFIKRFFSFIKNGVTKAFASEHGEAPQQSTLTISDFGLADEPPESKIVNAQLRLSMAAMPTGDSANNDKLKIEYFFQDSWHKMDEINITEEISNKTNGGYFLYGLPIFESPSELKNIKTRVSHIFYGEEKNAEVFLDAVWMEIEMSSTHQETSENISKPATINEGGEDAEPAEETTPNDTDINELIQESIKTVDGLKQPVLHNITSEARAFSPGSPADFTLKYNNQGGLLAKTFGALLGKKPEMKEVKIINGKGKQIIADVSLTASGGSSWKIEVHPPKNLTPGKHTAILTVKDGNETYVDEFEFRWGVLAINTNKATFAPGETAYIQMAALTDTGNTICDASLNLEITPPGGSPKIITVSTSGECDGNNFVEVPDYFAHYETSAPGDYKMRLARLDENGNEIFSIKDYFRTREYSPFEIKRVGPTRINPIFNYKMGLEIKANENFSGEIVETIPDGFKIRNSDEFEIRESNNVGEKEIVWNLNLEEEDVVSLEYTFDAPDVFPELYLLGPLELSSKEMFYEEARMWQVASDGDSQFARPNSDVSTGIWTPTPLFQEVNEATRDDNDFINSDNHQTELAEMGLSDVEDPGVDTDHILRYTYRKDASGGFSTDFRIRLLQGGTEIASFTHTGIGTSFTQANQTLTQTQASNITDYTDLRVTVECLRGGSLCSGGQPAQRRGVDVSWIEFDVPVPVANDPPTMSTHNPVDINETSVTASGTITNDGGGTVTERGFVWGTSTISTPSSSTEPGDAYPGGNFTSQSGTFGEGQYSLPISNLEPGTTYFYRSYAENSEGFGYGNEVEFSTLVSLPEVTTNNASNIATTSATGNGDITSTGGESENVTERGFVWATSSQSDPGDTAPENSSYTASTSETGSFGTGNFSLSMANLETDTTYFYRAYAENSEGFSYGEEKEFTTLGDLPAVSTNNPSNISQASADGQGSIDDIGANNPTERGFVWATSSQSNPGDTAPENSSYTASTSETGSFGTGNFSLSMENLDPDTNYFYRAYAMNTEGYSYGNEVQFTTLDELPEVDTNAASNIKTRSATGNGNITDNGGLTITERGFVWDTNSQSQPSSSTAPGDSDYEFSTTTTGTFGTGSFNINLVQLEFNTTYRYRAYARNSAGYFYGPEVTFTTANAQFSRPTSTDNAGGWTPTPLHPRINSENIDFGTTIVSDDNTSPDTATIGMSTINTPDVDTGHFLRYVFKKDEAGGHQIDFTIRLLHDGTEIASSTYTNITTEFFYAEDELTESQAQNITDYSLLTVEITRNGDTGGPTRRRAEVSWVEFETPAPAATNPPTAVTSPASNIDMFDAQGNGSVTDDGNLTITERGFSWATSSQPTPTSTTSPSESGYTASTSETGSFGEGNFNLTMSPLSANTTYFYRAFAQNSEGWGWGTEREFETLPTTPLVETDNPDPIDALFVGGQGNLTHLGNSSTTERGFVWSTSSQATPSSSTAPEASGYAASTTETDTNGFATGIYSLDLTSLNASTTYFYRSYAKNDDGYAYGNEVEFTTKGPLPELTTLDPPDPVGPTTATGTANITFLGASDVTERGFVWSTSSQATPSSSTAPESSEYPNNTGETDMGGFATGTYEMQLTNLEESTTYFYRGYAKNDDGYTYGNEVEFTTIGELAVVDTLTAENVATSSADGKGDIKTIGIGNLTERGFVWDTTSHAQPASSTAPENTPYPNSTSSLDAGGFGTGEYTLTMESLDEGRVYFYRAYVLNDAGYTYGNEVEFSTPSERPTVVTHDVTDIDLTQVVASGTIVDAGATALQTRGFVWSTSSQAFPGDVTPANSGYNNNISEGAGATGAYSMTLTSLEQGTVYFARSFAQNSSGDTGYNYGSEVSFMTQSPPEITDVVLNDSEDITLLPGTTTPINVTATATDPNGWGDLDESTASAVIYREGASSTCSANDNNCYITTNCSLSNGSGNSATLTCTADIQFFAEPTNSGTEFENEKWLAEISIQDSGGNEGEGADSSGVDLMELLALQVIGPIDYGSIEVGENSGGDKEVVVTNAGNVPITTEVEGTNMTGPNTISISQQKFATSVFNYETEGTTASTTPKSLGISLVKPTSTTPVENSSFWGLGLPMGIRAGNYQGTNTFWAISQ